MKILINFIKTLFKAILSFVSKGEGAVKKEFGIDIYKASVQELKNKHKEINEDLIDIETEEAFSVQQLETLRDSLPNLKKEIQKARKEKDKVKFSKLASLQFIFVEFKRTTLSRFLPISVSSISSTIQLAY